MKYHLVFGADFEECEFIDQATKSLVETESLFVTDLEMLMSQISSVCCHSILLSKAGLEFLEQELMSVGKTKEEMNIPITVIANEPNSSL